MRSVLFCNEVLGLGHLRRSLALAGALTSRRAASGALVVTGSYGYRTIPVPAGVDLMKVPAVPVEAGVGWASGPLRQPAELGLPQEDVLRLREQLSLAIVRSVAPDVVVVDHAPLGQGGDLSSALEWLRGCSGATVALGLRDFDDHAEMRQLWSPEVVEAVGDLYDMAILYGDGGAEDPRLEALGAAGIPVHRTGLVAGTAPQEPPEDLPPDYVLATVGGGVDGFPLLSCVLDALHQASFEHETLVVTGPMMPPADVKQLRQRAAILPVRLERERSDMAAVIAGARAVVSMAGYATVAEILGSGKPALLVPRVNPRAEQLGRARHWSAAGQVRMLDPAELEPGRLGAEIAALLAKPPREQDPRTGAAEAAELLTMTASRA